MNTSLTGPSTPSAAPLPRRPRRRPTAAKRAAGRAAATRPLGDVVPASLQRIGGRTVAGGRRGALVAGLVTYMPLQMARAALGDGTPPTRHDYDVTGAGLAGLPDLGLRAAADRLTDQRRPAAARCVLGVALVLYGLRMLALATCYVGAALAGLGAGILGAAAAGIDQILREALRAARKHAARRRQPAAAPTGAPPTDGRRVALDARRRQVRAGKVRIYVTTPPELSPAESGAESMGQAPD